MILFNILYYFRSKFEAIPDNLTPDEILKQAQNAAKAASEKLASKNTKVFKFKIFVKKNLKNDDINKVTN